MSVTVTDQVSVEGDELQALTFEVTGGQFFNEDRTSVRLTKADGLLSDTYVISGICSDSNYNVTFTNGVYTILQRNIPGDAGVQIEAEGGIVVGASLAVVKQNKDQVKDIVSKEIKKQVKETLENKKARVKVVFDIKLMKDAQEIQPDGKIKVTIDIPEKLLKVKNLGIIYIASDGTITEHESTIEGNQISFVTDHLSTWAIVGDRMNGGIIFAIVFAGLIALYALFLLIAYLLKKTKTGNKAVIAYIGAADITVSALQTAYAVSIEFIRTRILKKPCAQKANEEQQKPAATPLTAAPAINRLTDKQEALRENYRRLIEITVPNEYDGEDKAEVVYVCFANRKAYCFAPNGLTLEQGDIVLVPSYNNSLACAAVVYGNVFIDKAELKKDLVNVDSLVVKGAFPPSPKKQAAEETVAESSIPEVVAADADEAPAEDNATEQADNQNGEE